MYHPILITGSAGLIGCALAQALRALGVSVRGLDLNSTDSTQGDVREPQRVRSALRGCSGIIHLAAVSRVVWAEDDPDRCRATNIDAVRMLLQIAVEQRPRPWLIFASSREVYGSPATLPATEETPLRPLNVYGRSKAQGESLVSEARAQGLHAAIVRLSNVYGSVNDHPDRVVPAFIRAALANRPLRVDGPDNVFDFTYVEDVAQGIVLVYQLLDRGEVPPAIQFVSGVPTTLDELARTTIAIAGSNSRVVESPPRAYDVARFYGSFDRARSILGWTPRTGLREGLTALIRAHQFRSVGDRQEAGAS